MVKNKKHFSPLGTKLYFHVNSSKTNSVVLTTNTPPTWPPCHVAASQEFVLERLACERSWYACGRVGLKVDCKTVRIFVYSSTLYARTV